MDLILSVLSRWSFRRTLSGRGWYWLALAGAAFVMRRARQPRADDRVTIPLRRGDRFLMTPYDPVKGAPGD
jgi:hypothetical protein